MTHPGLHRAQGFTISEGKMEGSSRAIHAIYSVRNIEVAFQDASHPGLLSILIDALFSLSFRLISAASELRSKQLLSGMI